MFKMETIDKRQEARVAKKTKGNVQSYLVSSFFILAFSLSTNAQCAMCRAAIESEGDTTKAAALNDGIVYLMAIPYVLVGLVGFAVYKMYANKKKA
jgi:hypothetical protein